MHSTANAFVLWIASIDWPAWIAAIGTAGSLLLGFIILARDRYVERRASADGLVTVVDTVRLVGPDDKPAGYRVSVSAYNAGIAPIFIPTLFSEGKHSLKMMTGETWERACETRPQAIEP